MIRLYKMNIRSLDPESVYDSLSGNRKRKIDRLKNETVKRQSSGAELLLNLAVKDFDPSSKAPAEWDTDNNGKLYLTAYPKLFVNLSHSGDYAVCAASDRPVGVDIQRINSFNPAIAERFFTKEETDFITRAEDPITEFYRIWVKKESLVKADGRGLMIPLSSFCVLGGTAELDGVEYEFFEKSVNGYRICVCVTKTAQ